MATDRAQRMTLPLGQARPPARREMLALIGLAASTMLGGCLFEDTAAEAARAFDEGDYAKARRLWKALSAKGDSTAPYNLGRMYALGRGARPNEAIAAQWLEVAALRGNALAQSDLSVIYAYGRGVSPDLVRAYAWATLAGNGFPDWSKDLRDIARRNRDAVARRMTAAELNAAQALIESIREDMRR